MLVSRPSLKKALRVVRRDQCTVQLGIDPERAVVFRTPSTRVVELIQHLDGRADLVTLARRHDLPVAAVQQVVRELSAAGVLDSTPVAAGPVAAGPVAAGPAVTGPVTGRSERTMRRLGVALAEHRRRLEPDLAAWSLLDAAPDGGAAELDRRAAATVAVVGGGRLGTAIGLLLASAGIGGLVAEDDRIVRHSDRVPAGLGATSGVPVAPDCGAGWPRSRRGPGCCRSTRHRTWSSSPTAAPTGTWSPPCSRQAPRTWWSGSARPSARSARSWNRAPPRVCAATTSPGPIGTRRGRWSSTSSPPPRALRSGCGRWTGRPRGPT